MAILCKICKCEAIAEKDSNECSFCLKLLHYKCVNLSDHQISLIQETKSISGMMYFCDECHNHVNSFSVFIAGKVIEQEQIDDEKGNKEDANIAMVTCDSQKTTPSSEISPPINENSTTPLSIEQVIHNQKQIAKDIELKNYRPKVNKERKKENNIKNICKHFLKGICRYKSGQCTFDHPSNLCNYFNTTGKCKFGEKCKYEHLQVCKYFAEYGYCRFGARCYFLHPKLPICKFFREGYCKKDKDCNFFHSKRNLMKPENSFLRENQFHEIVSLVKKWAYEEQINPADNFYYTNNRW